MKNLKTLKIIFWFLTIASFCALVFVGFVYPEVPTASLVFAGLLLVGLAVLAWIYQQNLKHAIHTRNFKFGVNAIISSLLVLALIAVLNVLNFNHYYRKDLTKNKIHSLSDQTIKTLKNLNKEVKLTVFTKTQNRDELKKIIDNYVYYAGSKLKVEYVDPDRDPARAKSLNIKKYGTVVIQVDKKENRVEDINEEKLTNAINKVLKDNIITACFLTGHGERSIDSTDAEGLSTLKQELLSQNYEVKTVNLFEEAKMPKECTVLLVIGSNKAFFDKEIKIISDWLDNGGRALFGLDPNVKGGGVDFHPELTKLLDSWYIEYQNNLVIDPTSRLLGASAGVPIVAQYNKAHPITQDFELTTLFSLSSVVEVKSNPPTTLKTFWIAKTTPRAFVKKDFKEIASGQVKLDPKVDKEGAHTLMVAVEGARSPNFEKTPARIVAMGTSAVAINSFARFGANMDLFLNSVSWLANDESMISIRPKEEESQAISLSNAQGRFIQLLTMIVIPGGVVVLGIGNWIRRRKL
jgi:ABC-type uncharacterized transport system involved in gliding motility auxiliary subunit